MFCIPRIDRFCGTNVLFWMCLWLNIDFLFHPKIKSRSWMMMLSVRMTVACCCKRCRECVTVKGSVLYQSYNIQIWKISYGIFSSDFSRNITLFEIKIGRLWWKFDWFLFADSTNSFIPIFDAKMSQLLTLEQYFPFHQQPNLFIGKNTQFRSWRFPIYRT